MTEKSDPPLPNRGGSYVFNEAAGEFQRALPADPDAIRADVIPADPAATEPVPSSPRPSAKKETR